MRAGGVTYDVAARSTGVLGTVTRVMHRIAIFSAFLAMAAPSSGADLLEIYRMAQGSDAQYAAARATWSASQERLPQGLSGLLPSASVSASTQNNDREFRSRDPAVTSTTTSRFNSNSVAVSVSQPLYRPQNLTVYEQAKTQVAQADAVFSQASQDLLLRVAQAYFDVLLAQDTVVFAQAQLTAIAQQLAQAKRNFEVGTAPITDTHEAQSRYDLTVSVEITAKNELEVRKRQLELLIGRPAPGIAPLGKRFALRPPENSMDRWVADAGENNLQVRISRAGLDFATQEIERTRAGHRPTVDAFATYSDAGSGFGNVGIAGNDTTQRIVGVQLAIPIYQGGLTNSRVREAVANEDRARQELENARRTAELTARQTYLGVNTGISQVKALEAALVSSRSLLDSTRLGQEVGVRTQIDVLNAQQQLSQTLRDLSQAKYNYILAQLRLKAAAGQLTEQDLAQVNTWLDR